MLSIFKNIICCLLMVSSGSFCYAQNIDSIKNGQPKHIYETIKPEKFKIKSFVIPVALIGYGFVVEANKGALKRLDLSTKDELQEDHPAFTTCVDDYMQFAPMAAVYALNFSGVKGEHTLGDATFLYLTSAAIMSLSTHLVKNGVGRHRPDGSAYNSFPSGHTASAFMAAEFLNQEYKGVSPWIGYAGYFVATATGILRMYNNRHWFSDVVTGAGFGIASTKISYLVYPYIRRLFVGDTAKNYTLMPLYQKGVLGLMLLARF